MTPRHYSGLGSDLNLGPGNTHTHMGLHLMWLHLCTHSPFLQFKIFHYTRNEINTSEPRDTTCRNILRFHLKGLLCNTYLWQNVWAEVMS